MPLAKERIEGLWRKDANYIFIHRVSYDGDEKFMPFDMLQVTMSTPRGWVPFGELDPNDGSIGVVRTAGEGENFQVWVDDHSNLNDWKKVEYFELDI
jgi:hypothetical protein